MNLILLLCAITGTGPALRNLFIYLVTRMVGQCRTDSATRSPWRARRLGRSPHYYPTTPSHSSLLASSALCVATPGWLPSGRPVRRVASAVATDRSNGRQNLDPVSYLSCQTPAARNASTAPHASVAICVPRKPAISAEKMPTPPRRCSIASFTLSRVELASSYLPGEHAR